jgi:hypothetical protein
MYNSLLTCTDEIVGQFWTEAQRWAALTDGQTEYTANILTQYKAKTLVNPSEPLPEILRSLYQKASLTISASAIPLPSTFLYDLSVYLAGTFNRYLIRREDSKKAGFDKKNPYLGASGYYYSLDNSGINLEIPTPSSLSTTIEFLQKPTQIIIDTSVTPNVTIEPILPDYTHWAIVVFAFAQLLNKNKLFDIGAAKYKEFTTLVRSI